MLNIRPKLSSFSFDLEETDPTGAVRTGSPDVLTGVAGRRLVAQRPHPARRAAAGDPGLTSLPAGSSCAHTAGVAPDQNRRALDKRFSQLYL